MRSAAEGEGPGIVMSNVVNETDQEFWQPPSPAAAEMDSTPAMAEVCRQCATEFLPGSRFCYTCGHQRLEAISSDTKADAAHFAGLWVRAVATLWEVLSGLAPAKQWFVKTWRRIELPV